jgi:hypothetical protein
MPQFIETLHPQGFLLNPSTKKCSRKEYFKKNFSKNEFLLNSSIFINVEAKTFHLLQMIEIIIKTIELAEFTFRHLPSIEVMAATAGFIYYTVQIVKWLRKLL